MTEIIMDIDAVHSYLITTVAVGSNLTVDKFLELKRGERDAEYEKDLRS